LIPFVLNKLVFQLTGFKGFKVLGYIGIYESFDQRADNFKRSHDDMNAKNKFLVVTYSIKMFIFSLAQGYQVPKNKKAKFSNEKKAK
jgi:hypothetical protein